MVLPYSVQQSIQHSLTQTQELLSQAQRLTYSIDQIDRHLRGYIRTPIPHRRRRSNLSTMRKSAGKILRRLSKTCCACRRVSSNRSQPPGARRTRWSQQASPRWGALQAAQAGNQLTALQIKQLAELTALTAAQSRANTLAGARNTANQSRRAPRSTVSLQRSGLSASTRSIVPVGEGQQCSASSSLAVCPWDLQQLFLQPLTLDQTAGERSAANAGARADGAELGCRRVSGCEPAMRFGARASNGPLRRVDYPPKKSQPPLSTDQAPQPLATPTFEPAFGAQTDRIWRPVSFRRGVQSRRSGELT